MLPVRWGKVSRRRSVHRIGALLGGLAMVAVAATACGGSRGQVVAPVSPEASQSPTLEIDKPDENGVEMLGPEVDTFGMVTPQALWATSSTSLLLTSDAGATWREVTPAGAQGMQLRSGGFSTPQVGRFAGLSGERVRVFRTKDSGQSWEEATIDVSRAAAVTSLTFVDASHGWMLVQEQTSSNFSVGRLFATNDGGVTWEPRSAPAAGQMTFFDANEGLLVGGPAGGQLHRTDDGGRSWAAVELGDPAQSGGRTLGPVAVVGARMALLALSVPQEETVEVRFYRSSDRGQTWQWVSKLTLEGTIGLGVRPPVDLLNATSWLVAAPKGFELYRTDDSGTSYLPSKIPDPFSPEVPGSVVRIDFATHKAGAALASTSGCLEFKTNCEVRTDLLYTRDGGESWQSRNP